MQALVTDRAAFAAAQRQVVAAAIAAGRCSRCKDGSGFVKHSAGRLHCGVPNLCFACDGAGTREAELAIRARTREAERLQGLFQAAQERCRGVAERAGTVNTMPPRARREAAYGFRGEPFTAAAYAAATGLEVQAAYTELCGWTYAQPVIDPASGRPTGWRIG